MEYFIVFIVLYLIGSISPAVITGKLVKGIDIRDVNTKNAGASNAFVTLGSKYGFMVGIIDILKGLLPIIALRFIFDGNDFLWFVGGLGIIIGHVYPVYMGFRGGKGTSTFVGILIGGAPIIGLVLLVVLIVSTYLTDYVAIGTLIYIILAPLTLFIFDYNWMSVIIVVLYSSLSFYKHSPNFMRVLKKEESHFRSAFKKE